ncbi:MAG: MBL fold metallo-hydrolase [Ruminiclostridium sp.]|nr:MBL fold metallo-hydrolase [Ruminiclostridium sp.]
MRIVSLIENTSATEQLKAEHGLSFYVENCGERYLIDTGASDKLVLNAQRMRLDLSSVRKIALSHCYSDHTGGIESIIKLNPEVKIYAKEACKGDYYVKYGMLRISVGTVSELSEEYPDNFIFYNRFHEIAPGFFAMSNEIPDYTMYCEDPHLYKMSGNKLVKDDFLHESFFVIFPDNNRDKGCVVISSCSHCGIVNILKTVKKSFPESPIISVIGGFHLMGSSTKKLCCSIEYVDKTVNEIKAIETGAIYTCHCTGLTGYGIMKSQLGDRIQYLQTGEELEF